ncbi:helix-turn-helix domain-containing protein [Pseudoalteromonas byunsanensis]|nr:helix-turn-helix domain-containing protein [Pseudoalteromonas byunsanensis]
MRSKYELANIVTVIAIVCLAGLVTFCYLNNSPWILPLWHMLNLLICCYITISAFNAAYTPKKAEELGINKALTIKKERLLDKETANSLSQQVIRLFTANKVYLDNALCLKKLSAQLNLTTHQTSELLNVHMKSSFYRLLNSYRVQHACNLLKDQKNAFTITDIMYNSGFNNKNTFYKEFKRHTGTSPSQWVKHNAREAKDLIQQLS